MIYRIAIVFGLFLTSALAMADDQWPGFRGDGSGTATADLPTKWSVNESIAWQADIPGYGQSSPVVWNDKVFVTSSDGPFQKNCQVHAYDLQSGVKLWTSNVAATTKVENYFRNSRAAPTSVVDDAGVYSFFASGDVTAMTHDGETLWNTPLIQTYGDVDNERGVASSLAQTAKHVFVLIDHHGPSYLAAIDKSTGEVAWKADRGDRVPSWSSPVVARSGERDLVITSSADTFDAYYVNKVGVLYCINQETGEQVFANRIGNPCWASAIGVTNSAGAQYVYFVLKNGFTVVLRPGDEYDQVARNQLWDAEEMLAAQEAAAKQRKANQVPAEQAKPKTGPERVFAGMPESQLHQMFSYGDPTAYAAAVAGDSLLIRTGQRLYCVRK